MRSVIRTAALALFCCVPFIAGAGTFRAYLSINGNDANPCSLGAPCRLLETALNAVNDGGEIWIVDSGNFNLVTANVTKSVSIEATPGAIGSIFAINGPAFNIATAGVKVTLKNLVIRPLAGFGSTLGIVVTSAASLTIDKCTIADLPNGGISVDGATTLLMSDTVVRNAGSTGIVIKNGVKASLARISVIGNTLGIDAQASTGTISLDLRDSVISRNTSTAVTVVASAFAGKVAIVTSQLTGNGAGFNTTGAASASTLTGNLIANNANIGVEAAVGAAILLADNTISGNGSYGVYNLSSTVVSTGTNTVAQNSPDTGGSAITTTPKI